MSTNGTESIPTDENWGVVFQSVPSRKKKEIAKRLEEIFALDRSDAEQILSNMPLILVDNVAFVIAVRVKDFFRKIGVVAETTNHDMIKKNCFQVVWPEMPNLSFFTGDKPKIAEAPIQEKKSDQPIENIRSLETKTVGDEPKPEAREVSEAPTPAIPAQTPPEIVSEGSPLLEEKPAPASPTGVDLDWERRTQELNEKLRKIHEEKQNLHVLHTEAAEKAQREFQERLEEEKKRSGEISKAYEDLQKEAQKYEALTREGEEWRSKALSLGEKLHELEAILTQKASEVEQLAREKEDLSRQSEKAVAEIRHELSSRENREQELLRKVESLEHSVREMTESLHSRDSALAQFEKQIVELAEKTQGYDQLYREHAQLVQERATIRQDYDAKLAEVAGRIEKAEEEHRRYRSHADRKNAAATRELGKWIHGVDALRQGLQKLILFLGSDAAVLDGEKKTTLRSPLTRGPDAPSSEKS